MLFQVIKASYTYIFRTTVRNGYNTLLLHKIYVNLRILTYIKKWDVPCLVIKNERQYLSLHNAIGLRVLISCCMIISGGTGEIFDKISMH